MDISDLLRIHHRARADQARAQARTQGRYAVQWFGRVQGHFDDAPAGIDQGLADRQGLVRFDATQNRDHGQLSHGAGQVKGWGHGPMLPRVGLVNWLARYCNPCQVASSPRV